MFSFDLDKFTFDLCDWVNQVEYGSSLTNTLKGEAGKLIGGGIGGSLTGGGGVTFGDTGSAKAFRDYLESTSREKLLERQALEGDYKQKELGKIPKINFNGLHKNFLRR